MKHIFRKSIQIVLHVFLWAILIACVALFLILLEGIVESCWYKYPRIESWTSLFCCIFAALLPPLVIAIAVAALIRGNLKGACISIVLFIPAYILAFALSAAVSLAIPAIYSYSSQPEDFGYYDARPDEILNANPPQYYPDAIPDNARDVRYIYYYSNTSAEKLYIAVSWQSSIQNITNIMSQIDQDQEVDIGNDQITVRSDVGYYNNAIFVDYNDCRICYVITSPWMSLPSSLEEAFAVPQG